MITLTRGCDCPPMTPWNSVGVDPKSLSSACCAGGLLTGQITSLADLAPDDWRRSNPRFSGEKFDRNLRLVEPIKAIAAGKGVTPEQLALA